MCNILALCICIYICIMYRFFIFVLCSNILYLCISLIKWYLKLYVYMLFICVYEFNKFN